MQLRYAEAGADGRKDPGCSVETRYGPGREVHLAFGGTARRLEGYTVKLVERASLAGPGAFEHTRDRKGRERRTNRSPRGRGSDESIVSQASEAERF